MNIYVKAALTSSLALSVIGCEPAPPNISAPSNTVARWYTDEQVAMGRAVFESHCSGCHGPNAEGTADWTTRDANGNFPPPPLDGSAHAWHHPLEDIQKVITQGGVAFGGVMPAFGSTLEASEISAAIAYFQHQWPDEIYERWEKIDEARRELSQEDQSL